MSESEIDFGTKLGRNKIVLGIVFFILFVTVYIFLKVYIYQPSPNSLSYKNNNFYVFGLNIPSKLDFCGEKIPSNDMGIKKDLEKEFFSDTYWKAHSRVLFERAQRWFPVIEPILKEEGVPDDFKYLAVIESHLSNVTSPVGAVGFWQLVRTSAYGYGLEVSENVDERLDVEKATHAACQHIKDAYKVFKNWTLCAAAYNRGIGGIQNALRAQQTDNYYDLLLNSETGSFIYRVLAFKTLLANPEHFGIKSKKRAQQRMNLKSFKVDSNITDIKYLAKFIDSDVKTLRQFNPWLLSDALPNAANKTYVFRVPKNRKSDYSGFVNDMNREQFLAEAAAASATEGTLASAPVADSAGLYKKAIYYVVKVDEPLKNLAEFFKISVEDLRKWNTLPEGQNAVKGQTLTIYYFLKKE